MTEGDNKLKTYPFISSSISHRGIPNRQAPVCFDHAFHRAGLGEIAWTGQITGLDGMGGSSFFMSVSINAHMGQYTVFRRLGSSAQPYIASREYTQPR